MKQNIFKNMITQMAKSSNKSKLLENITLALNSLEGVKSLFGEDKIYAQMSEKGVVEDITDISNITMDLLSYKYRLTHDKKSFYNSNSVEDTSKIVGKLDSALNFILSIVIAQIPNLKDNKEFGNFVIRVAFNDIAPEKYKDDVVKNINDIDISLDLFDDIFWLNVPLGKVTSRFIPERFIKTVEVVDLMNLLKRNIERENHKYPGVVFFELFSKVMDEKTMAVEDAIALFKQKFLSSSFFENRRLHVCSFIYDLGEKIGKKWSNENLVTFEAELSEEGQYFSNRTIFYFAILGKISVNQTMSFLLSAIARNNMDSARMVIDKLKIVDESMFEPSIQRVFSTYASSRNISSYILELRGVVAQLGIDLNESDFMEILMTPKSRNTENFHQAIADWALNLVMENEIPQKEDVAVRKAIKF